MGLTPLVLASHNAGKLREFSALLSPAGYELRSASALGLEPTDEPHATFIENALAKARAASAATGLASLADDSGLCCDALLGAPGIRSARFAGEPADDRRNNAALLRALQGSVDRRGHYVCVLVALCSTNDPEPLVAQAQWHGEILLAPRGEGGFGYDPLFWLPSHGCSVAELPADLKNLVSHRAKAMQLLLKLMAERWRPAVAHTVGIE